MSPVERMPVALLGLETHRERSLRVCLAGISSNHVNSCVAQPAMHSATESGIL
jgi:hypothetical protein